jgi:hypothetical protein
MLHRYRDASSTIEVEIDRNGGRYFYRPPVEHVGSAINFISFARLRRCKDDAQDYGKVMCAICVICNFREPLSVKVAGAEYCVA